MEVGWGVEWGEPPLVWVSGGGATVCRPRRGRVEGGGFRPGRAASLFLLWWLRVAWFVCGDAVGARRRG